MGEVFISYRRNDSERIVQRLYKSLTRALSGVGVFRDLGGIEVAEDWMDKIRENIDRCYVFLVVIGRDWLESDDSGAPRIKKRDDVVRREIERALRRVGTMDAEIVPVLVSGASMPRKQDLPGKLKQLHRIQAHRIRDSQFGKDVQALSDVILSIVEEKRKRDPENWTAEEADAFLDDVDEAGGISINGVFMNDFVAGKWQCKIASHVPEQQPWFKTNGRATLEFYVPEGSNTFEGVWRGARSLPIEGSWMFRMDPATSSRVFGVRLRGVADGADPFDVEIPTDEVVGEVFQGTDQAGRHYALRLLERAGI